MKKAIFPLITILTIVCSEHFARTDLFSFVSYYNYDAIDWQMSDLSRTETVDILFLGSSEVRYGLSPEHFDEALKGNGGALRSFNLGIDGMNLSFYDMLLPFLYPSFADKSVKYAVIGVNLAEDVVTFPKDSNGQIDCGKHLGDLQRGVFFSPFGLDSGLSQTCQPEHHKWWIQTKAERLSYSFRHRKAFRAFLLRPEQRKRSRAELNITERGYHVRPHAESQAALDEEFAKWWEDEGKKASSLDGELFKRALEADGVYGAISGFLRSKGIQPVFVSLPTNPRMIDSLKRREIYKSRSLIFSRWASERGLLFIDLGLKDDYDPVLDFADRRHLSALGAKKFSEELGHVLRNHLRSEK